MSNMQLPTIPGMGSDIQANMLGSKVNTNAGGGTSHLKFGAYTGKWSFGRDNEDVTDEHLIIAAPTIVHGYHLWCDKKVNKRMAPHTRECPEPQEAVRDQKGKLQEPSEARGLQGMLLLEDVDGKTDAIPVSWEHSTDGCRRSIDGVLDSIMARAVTEAVYLHPKVRLTSQPPYENAHKEGEMIHPPRLEIIGWCNGAGKEAGEPAAKIAAPADDTVEEEEVEAYAEAPKRQRRKRTAAA